jgi:hypothetical protein
MNPLEQIEEPLLQSGKDPVIDNELVVIRKLDISREE